MPLARTAVVTLVLLAVLNLVIAGFLPIVGFLTGLMGVGVLAFLSLLVSFGIARFGARRGSTGLAPMVAAGAPAFLFALTNVFRDSLIDPATLGWLMCAAGAVAGALVGLGSYAKAPAP